MVEYSNTPVYNPTMPKSTAKKDAATAREIRAVDLRVLGWPYHRIAEEVGYHDASGARKAVMRVLTARAAEQGEKRDTLVQRELELIDACIAGLSDKIRRGDARAVEVALKASERRARLLGLDAPIRANVTVTDAMVAEIQALADELAANGPA